MPTSGGGRDRAFSFECFAFGINADEPLPPLDQSAPQVQAEQAQDSRPRGDSIIFDPSSFQDGGIHEQSALTRAQASAVDAPTSAPQTNKPVARRVAAQPEVASSSSVPVRPLAPTSSYPVTVPATFASANAARSSTSTALAPPVLACGAALAGSTPTTLSLELVNKDGRIGIYLPEARRQRIARFHAKRAKRIWRKRIKYDCRKKLADSRPRIKGRFVKRSDMDD